MSGFIPRHPTTTLALFAYPSRFYTVARHSGHILTLKTGVVEVGESGTRSTRGTRRHSCRSYLVRRAGIHVTTRPRVDEIEMRRGRTGRVQAGRGGARRVAVGGTGYETYKTIGERRRHQRRACEEILSKSRAGQPRQQPSKVLHVAYDIPRAPHSSCTMIKLCS